MLRAASAVISLLVALTGCTGTLSGGDDGGSLRDAGGGRDAGPGRDGGGVDAGGPRDGGPGGGVDAGEEPRVDAGPCSGSGLLEAFSRTPIAGLAASGPLHAAPTAVGGIVVAWAGGGSVHLTRVAARAPWWGPMWSFRATRPGASP